MTKRILVLLLLLLMTGCGAGEPNAENEPSGEQPPAAQSEQQKDLAALSVFGTSIGLDDDGNVVSLHFNSDNLSDVDLVHFKSMTKLEILGLDFGAITDAGLVDVWQSAPQGVESPSHSCASDPLKASGPSGEAIPFDDESRGHSRQADS